MIRICVLAVLLAGCAARKPAEPIYLSDEPRAQEIVSEQPSPATTPVTLQELPNPQNVLLFPDITPETTLNRLRAHLRACRVGNGISMANTLHGLELFGPSGGKRLSIVLAKVSKSSAISVDGSDFTPALKEELALAVQGRSSCTAV